MEALKKQSACEKGEAKIPGEFKYLDLQGKQHHKQQQAHQQWGPYTNSHMHMC